MQAVYIHIPFCKTICSYCDFCKFFYNENQVNLYLETLDKELQEEYQKEKIKTIYIGGGTPSVLNLTQLERLFQIVDRIDQTNIEEFTFEMNPEDITDEKLVFLKQHGVTRISIGHQTKNRKYLKELGRTTYLKKEQVNLVKKYFKNINVDFMYGFRNETKEEFLEDLEYVIELDVQHISTYSLILEEHTMLYIENYQRLEDELDSWMYDTLIQKLEENNFCHYEISNFSKKGYESRHNLVYWNNEEYYGFGLGASGYIGNIRYTNTRSSKEYIKGNRVSQKETLTKEDKMIYEMILGLRKIEGVSRKQFLEKYGCKIEQIFDIIELMNQNLLIEKEDCICIPKKYLYRENQILIHFLEVKK